MPNPFTLIGNAWEFARKQPVIIDIGLWMFFAPIIALNALARIP